MQKLKQNDCCLSFYFLYFLLLENISTNVKNASSKVHIECCQRIIILNVILCRNRRPFVINIVLVY